MMASLNIQEWSTEQVAEWMRGLDDALLPYVHFFLNNAVNGRHLLMLSADDLPNLHIKKLGHQEMILEAVELLRHFQYNMSTENLQNLALKLSCKARSLYNDLKLRSPDISQEGKQERVTTPVLSVVADMLISVKALVSWLDRSPFEGQEQYAVIRNLLLHISIELATNALRDKFAEKPIDVIKSCCLRLSEICDNIIQESRDPLVIQPASMDVATIKKKADDELGMYIRSSYSGIHHIGQVKYQSPAHLCARVEEGDEVVQVNYQTVIGWQLKKLVTIMRENPTEIVLTLKKRPRHANIFGQTFARTFFFPSKKASPYVHSIERPRETPVLAQFDVCIAPSAVQNSPKEEREPSDDDDSTFLPESAETSTPASVVHLFVPRPRAAVQRRATVTGASPNATRPPISIDQLWRQVKREQVMRSMSHDPARILDDIVSVKSSQNKEAPSIRIGSEEVSEVVERNSPPRVIHRPNTCLGTQTEFNPCERPLKCDLEECKKFDVSFDAGKPFKPDNETVVQPKPSVCVEGIEALSCKTEVKKQASNSLSRLDSAALVEAINNIVIKKETRREEQSTPKRKEHHPLREMLGDIDSALKNLRVSLHNLVGESKDYDTTVDKLKSSEDISEVFVETTSTSSATSLSQDQYTTGISSPQQQSYQVIIAGGVPQVSVPQRKESTRSPNQSPVLRRKGAKPWEFANRRVSCKDIGMGDCQGWLHKRKEQKSILTSSRWVKRWCILKNNSFYCYKDKDDLKAESLMYLPGFSVSPAAEIKSKRHAFKVYHSGTTFYFASDTQQDMSKWMNKMGLAAISYDATDKATTSCFASTDATIAVENAYYSETEDSSEDGLDSTHGKDTPSSTPQASLSFNSLVSADSILSIETTDSFPGTVELAEQTGLAEDNSSVSSPVFVGRNTLPKCSSDDEMANIFDSLYKAQLTVDGNCVNIRRKNTMLAQHSCKRYSEHLLLLRALQRTLKAKEQELTEIQELLSSEISSQSLGMWLEDHPHFAIDHNVSPKSEKNESD